MLDWAYRILGLVVDARFVIALLVAIGNTVLLLVEVQWALEHPSPLGHLSLLDSPLLLVLAVWLVAQLPPGVVFRPTGGTPTAALTADSPPADELAEQDGRWGCRASARFRGRSGDEWRLLAQSTLQLGEWGLLEIWAPTFASSSHQHHAAPATVRTLGWYRPFGARPPLWGSDHVATRWERSRRREPEPMTETTTRVAIPARARHAVVAGWQYSALRRYPALRLAHRGEDGREQFTYLAFGNQFARDAVLARLLDPPADA